MPRDSGTLATTDGRVPGRRGRATRQRLLECTAELLTSTPWRSIKVIDIARQAGTSPATFYQYFENVEQAILVLAEELMEGAALLAELVDGDWTEPASWKTATAVVSGFMDYWEANRSVFRVVELATEEGDLRFQGLRVRALNAVTVTLARVIGAGGAGTSPAGTDPMAVAATIISMLAHVAAHQYGFEIPGHPDHGHGRQPGPGAPLGRDRPGGAGVTIPAQYPAEPLLESDLDPDPAVQFAAWFEAATKVVRLPEAVALATADTGGRPSVRMVLLRAWDADGFVFHTDYESRKAPSSPPTPSAPCSSTGTPSAGRSGSRGRSRRRRPRSRTGTTPTTPQPTDRRPFVETEPPHRLPRRPGPHGVRDHGTLRGPTCPPARILGRLPAPAPELRVLAGPRRPAARPAPLHPVR